MESKIQVINIPRQTKFLNIPEADIQEYLQEVEKEFGTTWLNAQGEHRLQQLWHRGDPNSTIDLISLGYAIKVIKKTNPEWIKGCLGDIRSDDRNRQNGALFELNMIAWLIEGGMNVSPADYGEKGLDATIKFVGSDDLFVSMKSHDMSHHEQSLQANCEKLRIKAREVFGPRGHVGVSMVLTSKYYIESVADWEAIKKAIENWPDLNGLQEKEILPGVHLFITPMVQDGSFSSKFVSDSFVALVPFHKNEQINFMQKINSAVTQLKKQCADKVGKKACFMRLHQTADMGQMVKYATDIINEPGCEADLIVLYQPAYVNNTQLNTTAPTQYLAFIASSSWVASQHPINLRPIIGQQLMSPSRQKIAWPDGSFKDPPPSHYLYCVGWNFIDAKANEAGEAVFNVTRRPNLSVFPIFDGKVVTGLLPPNDEFLVL